VPRSGPDSTPYKEGTFVLYCRFPPNYPQAAPEIRFVTPVKHCNINCYGRICHSIFDRNYTVDTNMSTILECIYGLLLNPDVTDPLDRYGRALIVFLLCSIDRILSLALAMWRRSVLIMSV